MSQFQIWASIGLGLDVIGVILVGYAFFGSRALLIQALSIPDISILPNADSEDPLAQKKYHQRLSQTPLGRQALRDRRLGQIGTLLLILGFTSQITATFLSE